VGPGKPQRLSITCRAKHVSGPKRLRVIVGRRAMSRLALAPLAILLIAAPVAADPREAWARTRSIGRSCRADPPWQPRHPAYGRPARFQDRRLRRDPAQSGEEDGGASQGRSARRFRQTACALDKIPLLAMVPAALDTARLMGRSVQSTVLWGRAASEKSPERLAVLSRWCPAWAGRARSCW